jgi:hypothetical protein
MHWFSCLAAVAAIALTAACGRPAVSPVSPTPAMSTPKSGGDAILTISVLRASFRSQGWGAVAASYELTETSGQSGATLVSVLFEESGGHRDFLDAWCWGDAPIRIAPAGTLDGRTLGYCQPTIATESPGTSATLTVTYRSDDGRLATVRASTPVVH